MDRRKMCVTIATIMGNDFDKVPTNAFIPDGAVNTPE